MADEKIDDSIVLEAKQMLDQNAQRYHVVGCWVGLLLNPFFAITDYYNFPAHWFFLLLLRLLVSLIILFTVIGRKNLRLNASVLISIPLMLIALQNAYTYSFVEVKDLLGQNLNFMALTIGASMFVLWRWVYTIIFLFITTLATSFFVYINPSVGYNVFFVNGGLLLLATGVFMILLIQTRYSLTFKTITAQIALKQSKVQLEIKSEEIKSINENLEALVKERTRELERKNKVLEEYAFINSHKLRGPVARILGLLKLFSNEKFSKDGEELFGHLNKTTIEMDVIVRDITKTIEKGDE